MPTPDGLTSALHLLRDLGDEAGAQETDALLARLRQGDLRVVLAGEAKRGKSTLGNTLVGRSLLPTGVTPVTALATVIRGGEPERLEVDLPGGTRTLPLDALADFVTQQANPGNRRGAREVRVYLAGGLPHPRLTIVDTPGVGSLFEDNDDQTSLALEAMDLALLVLTADAPLSASETELLGRLAGLSVEVLVLLNKADLLADDDRDTAIAFVRDGAAAVLGRTPEVLACSGRAGLAARQAEDGDGWKASGLAAVADYLVGRAEHGREHTLATSIAAAGVRLALRRRDAVSVEAAALRAVREQRLDVLDEFAATLDRLTDAEQQARDLLAQELRRQRQHATDAAADEERDVLRHTRAALATLLAEARGKTPAEVEEQGRDRIAEVVGGALTPWREAGRAELTRAIDAQLERAQEALDLAFASVAASTEELLGVRLGADVPRLPAAPLPPPAFDFAPELGWNHGASATLRHRGPGARARTTRYLEEEAARLVSKQLGRIQAETRTLLDESGRRTDAGLRSAFTSLSAGLRAAESSARLAAGRSRNELDPRLGSLADMQAALDRILGDLSG